MGPENYRSILDKLNATSADICASVLMTKDGLALVSASPREPCDSDEDRISALTAAIMNFGGRLMDDLVGGGLEQVLIKSRDGYMLAIPSQELALAALVKPEAEIAPIFLLMEQAMESYRHLSSDPAKAI